MISAWGLMEGGYKFLYQNNKLLFDLLLITL